MFLLLSFNAYLHLLAPPLNWSKVVSKFLQIINHHIRVGLTGKRFNRGVGFELRILVKYFFNEMQVITWVEIAWKT